MSLQIYAILLVFTLPFTGCKDNKQNKEKPLAQVGESYLYRSDINPETLLKIQNGDSLAEFKAYVDNWVRNQVLVNQAQSVLNPEEKNTDALVEDYKNSLLIYRYEHKMVKENSDSSVSDEEINAFYEENQNNYELKNNIVKIRYLKIEKTKADMRNLKNWIQNPGTVNDSLLRIFAEKNALNFFIEDNWLLFDEMIKEIPLDRNYDQQRFLANNKFLKIEENNVIYLLGIVDYKLKNSVSPMEFEKDRIRNTILYQRKMKLLKQNHDKLMEDAINKGQVKYFIK